MVDKMDIVIQGKYDNDTDDIILNYLKLPFINNIIVSCWVDDKPFTHYGTMIKLIRSYYPNSHGTDNRNLQIISSLTGLKETVTPFVIKMRSDQLYAQESMMLMYDYFKRNYESKTLFVAGIYPKLLFHPRDHTFWGARKDVLALFEVPLEVNGIAERLRLTKEQLFYHYHEFVRSETYLGSHYIARFEPEIEEYLKAPNEYLYDNSPKWNIAKETSDRITHKYFKPFPREGVDLQWKRKGWNSYPYYEQHEHYGESWADSETKEFDMQALNEALIVFATDTENADHNYNLAIIYDLLGQTAAAISYFLRAAERTEDKNLSYECLLRIGSCFDKQGGRSNTVRGIFEQAIVLLPKRPEAYFLLSRFYERTNGSQDHVHGYLFAEMGLNFADFNQVPLRNSVNYPGKYGLIFEKAVCGWWWGKPDECRKLFQELKNNYTMDDAHRIAVDKNIQQTKK